MRRALALIMLAATLAAAMLIPSVALAAAPPGNADCLQCHAVGGPAISHVDFSAPAVDLAKCAACHWVDRHWFEVFHEEANYPDYMNQQCNTCHGADMPTRPALIGYPEYANASGNFLTEASLSATPGALHAIHANGSWPQDAKGDIAGCASCHGKAACDACHTAPPTAHADHTKSAASTVSVSFNIGKKYGDATPDAYLYSKSAATNYGGGVGMYVGDTGSGEERSIVRFPLTKAAGATVTTATLQLTRISSGANYALRAYRLRRKDWSETGASWNLYKAGSAWGTAGAKNATTDYYSTVYAESSAGNGVFNVTALVQAAIADGDSYVDILLVDPAPVSRRYLGFYTQQTTVVDWMPTLKVDGTIASSAYADPPITYKVAAGAPAGFEGSDLTYTSTSTCVSVACHGLAKATTAGQFVPACASCHPDRLETHGYDAVKHTGTPAAATMTINGTPYGPMACSACHSTELKTEHAKLTSSSSSGGCGTCHPTPRDSFTSWDKNCAQGGCHTVASSAPQHATIDADHAIRAENSSCFAADCHSGADLASLHSLASTTVAGVERTSCAVCHAAGVPATRDCVVCHPDRVNPHGYDVDKHTGTPAPATITISGIGYGPLACTDCHNLELSPEHKKSSSSSAGNGCSACHPSPKNTLVPSWNKTLCAQGGCHTVTSTAPMHATVDADHAPLSANSACFASGCHNSAGGLAAIHSAASTEVAGVVRTSCQVCHAAGVPTTKDCSVCHPGDPHGVANHEAGGPCANSGCHPSNVTAIHAPGPGCAACHGAGKTPSLVCATCHAGYVHTTGNHTSSEGCDSCHAVSNIISIHGDNCTTCHPTPATGMTWTGMCEQSGCHPGVHPDRSHSTHHNEGEECWDCHEDWSGTCTTPACHPHAYERTAPVTTSDAAAFYTGTATVHLTAVDPGAGAFGVRATYFQVDGGALQTGLTIVVPAPTSGVKNHTIEFWSTDLAYNTETHHIVSFHVGTAAPDTTPPTTASDALASYTGTATIVLTATDNLGGSGVAHTYYILDGQAAVASSTIRVTPPVSGSQPHTLQFYSVDSAGNTETVKPVPAFAFTVLAPSETIPPTGTMSVNNGATFATSTAGVVNSNVTDTGSGMADMRIDPGTGTYGSWIGYSASAPFALAGGDGTKTVRVQYRDVAANVLTLTDTIVVDMTAPTTTSNAIASYTGTATITFSATDNSGGSGVARTYYKLDGADPVLGTAVVVSPPVGGVATHTLQFFSVDNGGNVESAKPSPAFTFTVLPPTGSNGMIRFAWNNPGEGSAAHVWVRDYLGRVVYENSDPNWSPPGWFSVVVPVSPQPYSLEAYWYDSDSDITATTVSTALIDTPGKVVVWYY